MNNLKYLSKIIEFDEEYTFLDLSFRNNHLEEKYNIYNIEREKWKIKVGCILMVIGYLFYIFHCTLMGETTKQNLNIKIAGIVIDIVFCLLKLRILNNLKPSTIKIIKIVRYAIFYVIFFGTLTLNLYTFRSNSSERINNAFLIIILYSNLLLLYFLEFNLLYVAVYISLTLTIYILNMNYFSINSNSDIFNVIILTVIATLFMVIYQRDCLLLNKKIFFENYKQEKSAEYVKKLLDDLNLYLISMEKDSVLYVNNKFANEFNLNPIKRTNTNLVLEGGIEKNRVFNFLEKLWKVESEPKNLKMIIDLCYQDNAPEIENNFRRIGQFSMIQDKDRKFFEVYLRKNSFNSGMIIDVVMYDLTKIKEFEKEVCENKYKQKILGKIAHEFKTPLITISSIINSIDKNVESKETILKKIEHIKNLSDYTVFLISDVVSYVSDKKEKLEIMKSKVDLKEITQFSYNVLKTLIECNENKSKQIKTTYEFDEEVSAYIISSDEIRLKQILLNLISNAFKFTKKGEIKLKVVLDKKLSLIKVKVADSGIGINPNIADKILKEDTELNIEMEHNKYGSGIGLSITKMLSNLLNHNVSFKSRKKGGTKFMIEINVFNCVITTDNKKFSKETSSVNDDSIMTVKNICNYFDKKDLFNLNQYLYNESDSIIKNYFIQQTLVEDITFSIVIVDDVRYIRTQVKNIVSNILNDLNFKTFRIYDVSDGIDLLQLLKEDQVNDLKIKLILIDENMEFLNGSDSIRIIRNLESMNKFKKYKIVSVTAFENNDTKNFIISSKPDEIIQKPCSKNQLLNILEPMLV